MKRPIIFVIAAAMILFTFIVTSADPFQKEIKHEAVQGQLDLNNWSLLTDGKLFLSGEWEYYGDQLLSPEDFEGTGDQAPRLNGYVDPTGTRLEQKLADNQFQSIGSKTFRLTIFLEEGMSRLGISALNMKSSSKMFVNGVEVGASGVPGLSQKETIPSYKGYDAFFDAEVGKVEIILQVANYDNHGYSLLYRIWLGVQEDIQWQSSASIAIEFCGVVICFLIFLYHLYVYFHTRSKSSLYFAFIFVSLSMTFLMSGKAIVLNLFDDISYDLHITLLRMCTIVFRISFQMYLYVELNRFLPRSVHIVSMSVYIGFAILLIGTDVSVYSYVLDYFMVFCSLMNIYMLYRVILQWKNRALQLKQNALYLQTAIIACWCITHINNMLFNVGFVGNKSIGSFFVALMIVLSQIYLADRYIRNTQKMEQMDKVKEEFLINTSYYLKAPLDSMTNISGQMMKLEGDSSLVPSQGYVQAKMMNQLAKRISNHVNATIDMTLLKNNELKLQFEPVNVLACIKLAVDGIMVYGRDKAIQVQIEMDANLYVFADEQRFRQVILSLIEHFTSKLNTTNIAICARRKGNAIYIEIEDNNKKLSAEEAHSFFTPNINEQKEIDGLQMFFTRELTQEMGGKLQLIEVKQLEGNGIRLIMPAYLKKLEAQPVQQQLAIQSESLLQGWGNQAESSNAIYTILIVEDEYYNIQSLLSILENEQYQLIYAYSSEEALHIIHSMEVDLVLLDVVLQGQSGIAICREIRNQYSIIELPIILMTVGMESFDLEAGIKAGANDFIRKPFLEQEVIARVASMIEMKHALQLAVRNELAFLQAQIEPHFIYNAMNTIISFCYIDPLKAAHLLTEFSQYLRMVFDTDTNNLDAPISRELELIRVYMEIERARFGEKYQLVIDAPDELLDINIPTLCIQPLVENAIKHGLYKKLEGGTIEVRISQQEQLLTIQVVDNGIGMSDEQLAQLLDTSYKTGVGFSNIQKRIRQHPQSTMKVESEKDKGTTVTITFQLDNV